MANEATNVLQSTIDNCKSVLSKIGNLYCDKVLSDVILRVGAREYPAHRLILCASSDVFQVMLLKPEWNESCESVVVLHEAEECVPQFGSFLRYLYTGTVTLTHATVLPILALADKYNVEDLRVVCGEYMKQHLVSAAEHNLLLSWLQYCMASQHTAVAAACLNHFKWNFEQVARTSDFLNCDGGLLTSVLAQHDLVVHDEMTLYTYVVNWLNHQESRLQAAASEQQRPQRPASSNTTYGSSSHFSNVREQSTHRKQLALMPLQSKLDFKIKEEAVLSPDNAFLTNENANLPATEKDLDRNYRLATPSENVSTECGHLCMKCSSLRHNLCSNKISEVPPMDHSHSQCVCPVKSEIKSVVPDTGCNCSRICNNSAHAADTVQQSLLCNCCLHQCSRGLSHNNIVPFNIAQQSHCTSYHNEQCFKQQQVNNCSMQQGCSTSHNIGTDNHSMHCFNQGKIDSANASFKATTSNEFKQRFCDNCLRRIICNSSKEPESASNKKYVGQQTMNVSSQCCVCDASQSELHSFSKTASFQSNSLPSGSSRLHQQPMPSNNSKFQSSSRSNLHAYNEPPPLQLGTGKLYLRCSDKLGDSTATLDDLAQQMECLTYEVMAYVRFPMMTPRQLADLLLVPLTIQYKEFFVTRMAIGMAFHSGQWSRVREVVESGDESSRLLFTPRLYTAEQWSAGLTVDNLPALPSYHTRTLVFSTPASASELENEAQLEWIVELYPKGVWFRKYLLIVWQGTVEVPEAILRTVRLSVTYNNASNTSDKTNPTVSTVSPRVRLSVLIYAYRDGVEFVSHVVTRRHIFSPDDILLNIDDILPFDNLNDHKEAEKYLLPPCNSFKIHVVISPLSPPAYCPRSS